MDRRHPDRLYWLGDKGADVAALQRALMREGYELEGGADGELGPKTWAALQRYASDRGDWRPRLPPWIAPALLGIAPAPDVVTVPGASPGTGAGAGASSPPAGAGFRLVSPEPPKKAGSQG